MKIEKTTCPYCGASLKIVPEQKTAKCDYSKRLHYNLHKNVWHIAFFYIENS